MQGFFAAYHALLSDGVSCVNKLLQKLLLEKLKNIKFAKVLNYEPTKNNIFLSFCLLLVFMELSVSYMRVKGKYSRSTQFTTAASEYSKI